jgi:ubiquinone biosynthesis protein UbiJ
MANPLELLLRPIADTLNRNIRETTPAHALAVELNGSAVAIRVRGTALAMYFVFDQEQINLTTEFGEEPDVVISGSLLTLARMLRGTGEAAIRSGDVELTGDAATAQRFQKLLEFTKPDIEEELSRVIGDVAAHRIGELARAFGSWARDARTTMGENLREYLQEENRKLPTRYEVERFSDRVDVLRDDVERVAARLDRLESNRQ